MRLRALFPIFSLFALFLFAPYTSAQTVITSCVEFIEINDDLAGSYALGNDIDCSLSGNDIMIGTPGDPFTGTFDGGEFTVTVAIDHTLDAYTGLFRVVEGATISNLVVAGTVEGDQIVGGLAGALEADTSVTNVQVDAAIVGSLSVGGIAGEANGTDDVAEVTITASDFQGTISVQTGANAAQIGGIVGTGSFFVLDQVTSNGEMTIDTGDAVWSVASVGGLVGSASNDLTIQNDSFFLGDITIGSELSPQGTVDFVGGFVGLLENGSSLIDVVSSSGNIAIFANGSVGSIGGIAGSVCDGEAGCVLGEIESETEIEIDSSGLGVEVFRVGGLIGYVDGTVFAGILGPISSTLEAPTANGSITIRHTGTGAVLGVGGMFGVASDINLIEPVVFSEMSVSSPIPTSFEIVRIGGIIGESETYVEIERPDVTLVLDLNHGNDGPQSDILGVGGLIGAGVSATLNAGTVDVDINLGDTITADEIAHVGGVFGEMDSLELNGPFTVTGSIDIGSGVTVADTVYGIGGVYGSAASNVSLLGEVTSDVNLNITSGDIFNIGGVAGNLCDQVGCTASDVGWTGTMTLAHTGDLFRVGGFAGLIDDGAGEGSTTLNTVYSHGSISITTLLGLNSAFYVGGLVGYMADGEISDTYANTPITISSSANPNAATFFGIGGLVGDMRGGGNVLTTSYAVGAITFDGLEDDVIFDVGGLLGNAVIGELNYSFTQNSITLPIGNAGVVGSVVGALDVGTTLTHVYFGTSSLECGADGAVIGCTEIDTGETPDAFFSVNNAPFTVLFPLWDAEEVWYFSEVSYPTLFWIFNAPTVEVGEATDATRNSVRINGTLVSTGGRTVTELSVEYGLDDEYGQSESFEGLAFIPDDYEVILTGLRCRTTYLFRIVGENDIGTGFSEEGTFTTTRCPGGSSSPVTTVTPQIDFVQPVSGHVFVPGETVSLTWKTQGSFSYVNIFTSQNGGSTWEKKGSHVPVDITSFLLATTPNSGSISVRLEGTDLTEVLATAELTLVARLSVPDLSEQSEATLVTEPFYPGGTSSTTRAPSPVNGLLESVTPVRVGDLIRGASFDTVYLVTSEKTRRPFWSATVFATYGHIFSQVKQVTDATLPFLPLGAPMLPKAGSVLVKIDSIPNTYGTDLSPAGYDQIRWIPTEQDALQLIGSDWNQYIIDLPVFVFRLYEEGERLTPDTRGVWSAGPLRKRASLIL